MRRIILYFKYTIFRILTLASIVLFFFGFFKLVIKNKYLLLPDFFQLRFGLPDWFYVVQYYILLFTLAIIMIVFFTLYYSYSKTYKIKKRSRRIDVYIDIVLAMVCTEEVSERKFFNNIKTIKKNTRSEFNKSILITVTYILHYKTMGEIKRRINKLFNSLNFDKEIKTLLYSPFTKHKKLALYVISEFNLHGYEDYLLKLTKQEKRKLLHFEAMKTLIKLDSHNNLLKIIEMNVKISTFDINILLNNISNKEIPYKELIESNNNGFIILGLILIRRNNRVEFKKDIEKFIINTNLMVREETVLTLAEFADDINDFELLIYFFSESSENGKKAIVNSIIRMPDNDKRIEFLSGVIENDSLRIKLFALDALLSIDISKVIEFQKSDNIQIRKACDELLDINI
ncbi:MAG: hypothetical protein H6Q15_883 [Bacteroidetes bacterium]|nr:hypothetical protein [Bacteroidota bacterium]